MERHSYKAGDVELVGLASFCAITSHVNLVQAVKGVFEVNVRTKSPQWFGSKNRQDAQPERNTIKANKHERDLLRMQSLHTERRHRQEQSLPSASKFERHAQKATPYCRPAATK